MYIFKGLTSLLWDQYRDILSPPLHPCLMQTKPSNLLTQVKYFVLGLRSTIALSSRCSRSTRHGKWADFTVWLPVVDFVLISLRLESQYFNSPVSVLLCAVLFPLTVIVLV